MNQSNSKDAPAAGTETWHAEHEWQHLHFRRPQTHLSQGMTTKNSIAWCNCGALWYYGRVSEPKRLKDEAREAQTLRTALESVRERLLIQERYINYARNNPPFHLLSHEIGEIETAMGDGLATIRAALEASTVTEGET